MKNFSSYKTFSEYKKNSASVNINNLNIPSIYDRIIIFGTVNTGPNPKENNIIELSCMEMMGGKITGYEFDAYLHPRYSINEVTRQKTNLSNNFYEEYFKDVYASDKSVLEQFKNFVKQSKLISYNGNKEMDFINNELIYYKMSTFPKNKFYSAFNIFKQLLPDFNQNILSLNKCCDFLEITLPKQKYHTSKYDCFAVAKIISKLYDIIADLQNINENSQIKEKEKQGKQEKTKNSEKINELSFSGAKSDKSQKSSENDFEYSETLINMIEEENRNDENKSENIINRSSNEKQKKGKEKSDDYDGSLDISEKKSSKFLNNKRKMCFDDLINNLKSKVNPKDEEEDENENEENNSDKSLNEYECQQIEKEIKKKK